MTRARIAIVCQTASLKRGGEAAIPVRFFRHFRAGGRAARLYCHERSRPDLQEILSEDDMRDVVFFADRSLHKLVFRASAPLPNQLREAFAYPLIAYLCEREQKRRLKRDAAAGEINVVYCPTPISPKAVSPFHDLGAPVFFGPLNGAMAYPPAFRGKEGAATRAIIAAGRALAEALHYLIPGKARAAGLFVSNPRTREALPKAAARAPALRSYDATIEGARWAGVTHDASGRHFIAVGRLADWKAFEYAVLAAHALGPGAKLVIAGDGPEREKLERLAAQGPAEIVFAGFQTHEQLTALYAGAIAQVHPALREAGGNVCLESLAAGTPVISLDWGGAGDVVHHGVDGWLVEPAGEDALIAGLADAMRALADDPERARAMGEAGRARALAHFDWARKAEDIARVFDAYAETGRADGVEPHPGHLSKEGVVNRAWRSETA